jgi:hypothetical protein
LLEKKQKVFTVYRAPSRASYKFFECVDGQHLRKI